LPVGAISCIEVGRSESELLVTYFNYGINKIWYSADSGTTWIAVTDAHGKNLFTGKISLGQTQSFDASQLLNVTLGNSGAVTVNLDGKSLGSPGALGEVKYLQYGPGAVSVSTTIAG
jgi:hypothetical protein